MGSGAGGERARCEDGGGGKDDGLALSAISWAGQDHSLLERMVPQHLGQARRAPRATQARTRPVQPAPRPPLLSSRVHWLPWDGTPRPCLSAGFSRSLERGGVIWALLTLWGRTAEAFGGRLIFS